MATGGRLGGPCGGNAGPDRQSTELPISIQRLAHRVAGGHPPTAENRPRSPRARQVRTAADPVASAAGRGRLLDPTRRRGCAQHVLRSNDRTAAVGRFGRRCARHRGLHGGTDHRWATGPLHHRAGLCRGGPALLRLSSHPPTDRRERRRAIPDRNRRPQRPESPAAGRDDAAIRDRFQRIVRRRQDLTGGPTDVLRGANYSVARMGADAAPTPPSSRSDSGR